MQENDPRVVIGATAPQRSLAEVAAPHPWVVAARGHLSPSNPMLNACAAVVTGLARDWESDRTALSSDPWLDGGFADRFTLRLRWLTRNVIQPENLRLSDAEAALLVVFPYLHQAFWAKRAATVLYGTDPATAAFTSCGGLPEFGRFAAGHGALHRRGARAMETGDVSASSIGWWLFHQWLVRQPECYAQGNITSLLPTSLPPPLHAVLTGPRLMELMRAVQLDPAYLRRVDRPSRLKPAVRIAGGTELEQDVREQLLGYLLVLAHRTAIDPTVLPRVIADHIGIDDGITPHEVLTSIREAAWNGNRTRVLTTDCRHPATALALHDRAAAVDAVLTEIVRAAEDSDSLAPLKALPVHASADGTTPAASAGHRFRLADDRIQTLLMGEQLYGTSELAIRELYQNALDACRYREARTSYLARTGTVLPPWHGRISFRQGTDEQGRAFLECEDNGIGMGDRELVDVFAHAGVRFTDMPEYVEEQADWASVGVESFPNSRFGIGVLSYFMLADEITVTTCRLGRSGRPEQRLEVHIAGPDALFRVRELGPGDEAGTVVRLRLRPTAQAVRCTELLNRILWVSDFAVTSDDPSGHRSWAPRLLSPTAPVGAEDPLVPADRRRVETVLPTAGGRVWWCDTRGAVLADGLWAGTTIFGAVLDLCGRDQPRLTVDRERIIDVDHALVEERLRACIPELVTSPGSPLSHSWLSELAQSMPRLADEICDHAISVGYRPWVVGTTEAPIEVVGCYPSDASDLSTNYWYSSPSENHHANRWRLEAWLRAGETQGSAARGAVVAARPSDEILLGRWQSTASRSLQEVLQAAFETGRSPAEVVARLAVLGVSCPDLVTVPADARATDQALLRPYGNPCGSMPSSGRPVARRHVLRAAAESGLPPLAVVERLAELGFDTTEVGPLPATVPAINDSLLKTSMARGEISLDEAVPVAHIMVAAAEHRLPPPEVARQLADAGYLTPDPGTLPKHTDGHDARTFVNIKQVDGDYVRNPVPLRHVIGVAAATDRLPVQVVERLRAAGFDISPSGAVPEYLTQFDHTIICEQTLEGHSLYGLLQGPAEVGHVIAAALATAQTPVAVARRLAELGYECPPLRCLPDHVGTDDLVLVSTTIRDSHRYDPAMTVRREWLRTGRRVCLPHVVIAAARTALSPAAVAERLTRFGFVVPPVDPGLTVRLEDKVLLSVDLDGEPPWLDSDHHALARSDMTVPLGHVLAAAARLALPPATVAERLAQLGLRSETTKLPTTVDRNDVRLLARALPAEAWRSGRPAEFGRLGLDAPADELHLLVTAHHTGLTPAEVADRLAALGFEVADPQGLPARVYETDLKLLSESLKGPPPYRALNTPFPRGLVMQAVQETRMSPLMVLTRLAQLGITVGE